MSWRVMFSTLRRHSLLPALVLLQVALAGAILCNVLFLVWQRLEPMLAPTGVAADELILVDQLVSTGRPWTAAEVRAGEQALRQVPGVRAASAAVGLPMISNVLLDMALQGSSGAKVGVNGYMGERLLGTLGLQLVAGRDFLPAEYREYGIVSSSGNVREGGVMEPIIIPQTLADKLFGGGPALGKLLSDPTDKNDHGYQVVGIVKHLLRNELTLATDGRADDTVLLAKRIAGTVVLSYAVRVDPARRSEALAGVRALIPRQFGPMLRADSARVDFYSERRQDAFRSQRAALWLLAGVTLSVVIVTAIGIMGLTGFWVQRRTRQIGIRRALGARRVDILRYFLAENALIVGIGMALGMLFAYLGNLLLMHYYELQRLPWAYLPLGAAVMLLIGQLAVLGPALRAAAVPPVVATRSV